MAVDTICIEPAGAYAVGGDNANASFLRLSPGYNAHKPCLNRRHRQAPLQQPTRVHDVAHGVLT